MDKYVEEMINELPIKTSKSNTDFTPAGNDILQN